MADRLDRNDMRTLVSAVAQFAASLESRLRRIEPALTLSQLVALERIAASPHLRPFQLAGQMRISRQLAWQTCKRLETLGLLGMSNMSAGKRGVEVEATAAGMAYLAAVGSLHRAIAGVIADGEGADLRTVRSGLKRLTTAVENLPVPDSTPARRGQADDAPRRRAGRRTADREHADRGYAGSGGPAADPPVQHMSGAAEQDRLK